MKRVNLIVYLVLCVLFVILIILVLLNRGDVELRRALAENREFQIRVEGEVISTIGLQFLLDMEPQEFTASYATSISAPRDVTMRGVELRLLLDALEIDLSNVNHFVVSGLDSYYTPLSIDEVLIDENVYICYSMDGEMMKSQSEGGVGPYMLVIRSDRFAQRWCKYIEAVDVR